VTAHAASVRSSSSSPSGIRSAPQPAQPAAIPLIACFAAGRSESVLPTSAKFSAEPGEFGPWTGQSAVVWQQTRAKRKQSRLESDQQWHSG
jgi:hypothetical protein